MDATAVRGFARPQTRSRRWPRWLGWIGGVLAVVVVAAFVAAQFMEEPIRRHMEAALNRTLKGYSVTITALRLHPLRFSLTLVDARVRQIAHPDPPVLVLPSLSAGVHWRALLHGGLVADFDLDDPQLHINLPQLTHEATDKTKLKDKGWQDSLEQIYPLKVNQFRVRNGTITYVDQDPKHPLELRRVNFTTSNIRNIESPAGKYPSPVHLDTVVFGNGELRADGDADFFAVPNPAIRAHVEATKIPLRELKPVGAHANLYVTGGILSALGDIEFAPRVETVYLQRVTVDDVLMDYVHSAETAAAEAARADKAKQIAQDTTKQPDLTLAVEKVKVTNSTFGYIDQSRDPNYRLFISGAQVEIQNVTNRTNEGPTKVDLSGVFMDSGQSRMNVTLKPRKDHPDIDVAIAIEPTQLTNMNDMLQSYGNFDVVAGEFSLYSELHISHGQIDGYIKPLFADMKVYDRRQDRDKPFFHQVYEGLVGGVAGLLENRSGSIATVADIKGASEAPEVSTLDVIIRLVTNAFIKAILPGFEHSVSEAERVSTPPQSR